MEDAAMHDEKHGSLLGRMLKWLAIGLLAILAIKIAFGLVGTVMGLALFVVFKLGPILLLAWLGWMAWNYFRGRNGGNGNDE